MIVVRAVLFGLAGLAFGSFLTVLVHRVPRGERLSGPGSCPHCGAPIATLDRVPLLSYFALGGRCRNCRKPIPVEHPLVEAVTAALFVGAAQEFDDLSTAMLMAPFLGVMTATAAIDVRHKIIPNLLMYPSLVGFAIGTGALGLVGELSVARAWLGLLVYGGVLLGLALIYPHGMGMGDVKLAALIGLVLGGFGWRYLGVAAAVAVFSVGMGGVVALLTGRSSRDTIPFGPFLALGAVVAALFAPEIAEWYATLRS